MLFLTSIKFFIIFVLLPALNAVALHNLYLRGVISAYNTLLCSFVVSPALNSLILAILYSLKLGYADNFYLYAILIINFIPILVQLVLNKNAFLLFTQELFKTCKTNFIIKYAIALCILSLVTIASSLTPVGNDILEYFEIGKIFYRDKTIFYPVLPYYHENLFSSHATHPPFFTLMQSLCFLIQSSEDGYLVNNLLHGYYVLLFFLLLLAMTEENILLSFICIVTAIFTSNYVIHAYFAPRGLDTFRAVYFIFTFFVLEKSIINHKSKALLILLGISLGLSLSTHSSGLLFFILIIPIFLASYIPDRTRDKYIGFCIISFVAILIGGCQYFINFYHFSTPISDNLLLWSKYGYQEYMRYERDIYTPKKMLKQFLNLFYPNYHQYGYFYTLAIPLFLLNIKTILICLKDAALNILSIKQKQLPKFATSLLFVTGFYLVTLFSILLNNDLIVKNYRYLLTPYPFIIILIYTFLHISLNKALTFCFSIRNIFNNRKEIYVYCKNLCIELWRNRYTILRKLVKSSLINVSKPNLKIAFLVTCLFLAILPTVFFDLHKTLEGISKPLSTDKIEFYLKNNLQKDDVIFAFDRGDLYGKFQNAKINFYLNDTTLYYFDAQSAEELFFKLKNDKVKYIFTSSYKPFILNKSLFANLLANPNYTSLVVNENHYSLYRINDKIDFNLKLDQEVSNFNIELDPYEIKVINVPLDNGEYIVETNHISKEQAFYRLIASSNSSTKSNFTYNDSTNFRIKIDSGVLTLTLTAKDKVLSLLIKIIRLKDYVQK